ncbi:IS3 family transposase [Propionibacterium freudenreichii]|uniref:IS3 family transposase n=1 Tax=Propionibacterium freudenreichii TaxID=1744 RepID=UPI0012D43EBB|nr:IS3 family transposase [Propionibacterium freudenreichii]MCT2977705.1 IS3 family transposase [Propionibacterium freudenreichii]MCT2985476.1 IS3 family transposase [Propionibacterium freudenreichii]MCT2987711.1 IS3 family transposase [Propionibacterium freudenreichii]
MGVDPEQVPRRRRKFTAEYRHEAARLVLTSGRTIADVAKELGLGEQLLGKWVRAQKETAAGDLLSDDERAELKRLRRENSQLRMDNEFPGKSGGLLRVEASVNEKYSLMRAEKAHFSVVRMARLLHVSRSGYYTWVKTSEHPAASPRAVTRRRLDRRVRAAWVNSHRTYGAPRVHAVLTRAGVAVDRKTVAASMRRQGICGVSPRRFRPVTTLPGTRTHSIPDRCLRRWDRHRVNAVWVTDITYLRTREGWVYLCGVKDACSRKIISTAMSTTMTTDLVATALHRARAIRGDTAENVVIHSDRGAQFTSQQMHECCQQLRLDQSMGRTGVCWDNAMIESQWSVLKSEYYDRHTFDTVTEAIHGVERWITGFYNTKRLNSAIGYQTPVEFEASQAASLALTA